MDQRTRTLTNVYEEVLISARQPLLSYVEY